MKKTLQEIIYQLRKKSPKWMNIQNLIFFLVILAFIVIVLWSESLSFFFAGRQLANIAATPTPTELPDYLSSLPREWIRSTDQTSGVILGAIIIILTVVIGTIIIMIRDWE
jgi:Ca2+/Na+ antiporter